ncbi:MAG: hypothetical protein JOZ41_20425, partial [Chloroflexi bacterium]|nr:hypothetical protein [Chloroflexota bacterium]
MARPRLHSVLTLASVLAFCLPALATPPGASAAPVHQTAPPGIDPAHPAVSGRLVAKPITGEEPTGTVICGDRDRGPDVRASVIRGLVICTEEGQLVLLQISGKTGL